MIRCLWGKGLREIEFDYLRVIWSVFGVLSWWWGKDWEFVLGEILFVLCVDF